MERGPTHELPPGFHVLEFPPTDKSFMWVYATSGMTPREDAEALELHLFSREPSDLHVELLTVIAHYHCTSTRLGLGHTVNFGRPWVAGSECDHGLVSLPYPYGPRLEWLRTEARALRCLWLIPITKAERDFKTQHGLEALENRLEQTRFDFLDARRPSVV
jgi:hypothetical protein